MPNTNLNDILKGGENFELQSLDLSKKYIERRFAKVAEKQKISRERKKYDRELNDWVMKKYPMN
ncbi:MAG: hypothetical protein ACFFG0_56450 [Candidatus Thorarchaeota archaeon]